MADTEYTPDNDVWNNPEVDQAGYSPTIDEAANEAQAQANAANIAYKGAVMQSSDHGYANGDGEQFTPTPITEGPALSVESGIVATDDSSDVNGVQAPAGFTSQPSGDAQNQE